jgi:hypothetical protein
MVVGCVVVALVATSCQHVVSKRVDELRVAASVPQALVAADLVTAAGASAERMCAEGEATPTPDPLGLDATGFATAVDELVGWAELDPAVAEDAARKQAAVDAVWASWAADPTLVDPRWDGQGVGERVCPDGRLYLSLVLRDLPPGLHRDGKTWLFAGQDMAAIGGFPGDRDQGYVDYVGMPAGITTYIDLQWVEALDYRYDVGWGEYCSSCFTDSPAFDGAMIALGLHLVGDLPNVVSGARDAKIDVLGRWITEAEVPVFLRIGYEFDGSWNGYNATQYKAAFRRIVDRLRANGVTNLVTVWQSSGYQTSASSLLQRYPGDEYVDWVGYSYFNQPWNPGDGMLEIARDRRKPVMIAEATPKRNLSLGDPVAHWDAWFEPFFDRIEADSDVIKAVAYINSRWFDSPEWSAGWGDSRVQIRPEIKQRWIDRLSTPMWAPGTFEHADREYVLTPHDLTPP